MSASAHPAGNDWTQPPTRGWWALLGGLQAAALCNAALLLGAIVVSATTSPAPVTRVDVAGIVAAIVFYPPLLVVAHEAAHWFSGRLQGLAGGQVSLWSGYWPRPRYLVGHQAALEQPRTRLRIYLAGPLLDQGLGLAATLAATCWSPDGLRRGLWVAVFAGHASCLFNLLAYTGSDLGKAMRTLFPRGALARCATRWNLALLPASLLTAAALCVAAWRYVAWISAQ